MAPLGTIRQLWGRNEPDVIRPFVFLHAERALFHQHFFHPAITHLHEVDTTFRGREATAGEVVTCHFHSLCLCLGHRLQSRYHLQIVFNAIEREVAPTRCSLISLFRPLGHMQSEGGSEEIERLVVERWRCLGRDIERGHPVVHTEHLGSNMAKGRGQ